MSSESPCTVKRKYWGFVRPMPASILVALAKQAEDRGMQGLFAPQVYGLPPEKLLRYIGMIDSIFHGNWRADGPPNPAPDQLFRRHLPQRGAR